jgi:hypothetical protein
LAGFKRSDDENLPDASARVEDAPLVSTSVALTLADGTTAPLEACTVPTILAASTCARSSMTPVTDASASAKKILSEAGGIPAHEENRQEGPF